MSPTLSTLPSQEISYYIKKCNLSKFEVDIEVVSSSLRWSNFDIEFEYRNDPEEEWKSDAFITFTSANSISGNKIYGLKATQYGFSNLIKWNFSKNNLTYGIKIQIRIKILPRIRNFGFPLLSNTIVENYGQNGSELKYVSNDKIIIGLNRSGQYIGLKDTKIEIYNQLTDIDPTYIFNGLSNPSYAMQTYSGNYIVCDYGNNRVLELNNTLSSIVNNYQISYPSFIDYDNDNFLTLITCSDSGVIQEVSLDYSSVVWTSSAIVLDPKSATYSFNNPNEVIICDYGNNRIIEENKISGITNIINYYKFNENNANMEINKPYRAYKFNKDNIIIVEKSGKVLDFSDDFMSSSSSSFSSSSSSESIGLLQFVTGGAGISNSLVYSYDGKIWTGLGNIMLSGGCYAVCFSTAPNLYPPIP